MSQEAAVVDEAVVCALVVVELEAVVWALVVEAAEVVVVTVVATVVLAFDEVLVGAAVVTEVPPQVVQFFT